MNSYSDVLELKNALSARYIVGSRKRSPRIVDYAVRLDEALRDIRHNINGIGVGHKIVDGKQAKELSVRFYVDRKFPRRLIPKQHRLPRSISGIPVDVVECAPADFINGTSSCSRNKRKKQRPVIGGISAAHEDVPQGTLGAFCRSLDPNDNPNSLFALSNNHVFGDLNRAEKGDPILQPSIMDSTESPRKIARFHKGIPLVLGKTGNNLVDAAIAEVHPQIAISPNICSVGRISGVAIPKKRMKVHKHGRSTGYTEGKISDPSHDVVIRGYKFKNQILIDMIRPLWAFSVPGDSGSIIMTSSGNLAVGLLFATRPFSGGFGIANPMHMVLKKLNIELV